MSWTASHARCLILQTLAIQIDNGTLRDVYSSIEGAIIHGGVLATAFTRKTEATYDAAHWLKTGERVRVDSITITKITAERAL
jgi:hypothetical protein